MYKRLTEEDATTKKPGFHIQHVAAFAINMKKSIEHLSNEWKTNDNFYYYLNAKENVEDADDTNDLLVLETEWFKIASNTINKHFTQWLKASVLQSMIVADQPNAEKLVNWIIFEGREDSQVK